MKINKQARGIKLTFLTFILMICFSCFYGCELFGPANYDQQALEIAKQIVSNDLKNPYSAIWNDLRVELKDSYNRYVVYVDVSAQNGFGGYNRESYYVGFRIDDDGEHFYYNRYLSYITASGFYTAENAKNTFFDDWDQPPETE